MLAQDGERVSIAARVRRRRPGADDARVVPDDIGEYERDDRPRHGDAQQAAPLDRRQMFADGVELFDVGTACEQQPIDVHLLFQRHRRAWADEHTGSTAADHENDRARAPVT
jgi:hypothetical protein